jgi:hypothetical protein
METAQQRASRLKADAARRAQYVQRLRVRLQGLTTPGEIWRAAYLAGHHACYAAFLRRVRRGEILIVKPRRDRQVA